MPWPSPVTSPTRCRSAPPSTRPPRHWAASTRWSTPPASGPWPDWPTPTLATWRALFDTNVIGASLVTAAALPHLTASRGVAAYLSSTSASLTPAFPGLGAYAVSKAALNKLVEAWRGEHPDVGFTQVTVGDCAGGDGDSMTGFANGWDMDLFVEMGTVWTARQYVVGIVAGGGGAGQGGRHRPAVRSQCLHPGRGRRAAAPGLRSSAHAGGQPATSMTKAEPTTPARPHLGQIQNLVLG